MKPLRQLDRVRAVMADGAWHTLPGIAQATRDRFGAMDSEAAVSARLRDLRKEGRVIDRERSAPKSSLYRYRMAVLETVQIEMEFTR